MILAFVYPVGAALLSIGAVLLMRGITAVFEREHVREVFARFVPEAVVGQVLERADGARLGGVRQEVTVLFSDLRGFTSFSEQREPDEVIEILNEYLTEMSNAILDRGGTLVSYIGDGIMAVFGAPIEQGDHAERAVTAAREMLDRLAAFNASMIAAGKGEGFKMGIGLNSGYVMSGNVGSDRRLEYTVIGDVTNTAARLEGMTKGTPHQLYLAEATRALLEDDPADLSRAGDFEVRGREARIVVSDPHRHRLPRLGGDSGASTARRRQGLASGRRHPARLTVRERLPGGPLRTLLAVWLLLGIANWAFVVAVAVYAFGVDGAGGVGAVTAARVLPALVAAPLAGHLIDRGDRARVVAAFTLLQTAALAGVAALVLTEAPFGWIVLLVATAGALAAAPRPAMQAQMPALAQTPAELTRATAIWSALDNAGFLIGSGIGGIAIAALGTGTVLALAAAVCGSAALLALGLPTSLATAADEPAEEETVLEGIAGGFRALRETPAMWTPFGLLAGLLALDGASEVQIVALSLDNLDMGEGGPGAIYAAWGIGGLGGGVLVLRLLRRRGYGLALGVGAILFGLGLGIAGADGVALALLAILPAGLAFAMVETSAMGLVPRCADDAVVGRLYGIFELLYAGAGGFGALAAPPLVDWLGAPASMAVVGGAYALLGALAWRSLRRLDSGQEESTKVRELLRGVPFMASPPPPAAGAAGPERAGGLGAGWRDDHLQGRPRRGLLRDRDGHGRDPRVRSKRDQRRRLRGDRFAP